VVERFFRQHPILDIPAILMPMDGGRSEKSAEGGSRMQTKLYVGNLGYSVTSEDLRTLFANHGSVLDAKVIEGKGFGFVEMSSQSESETAKKELDGHDFMGRNLKVDLARPPKSKPTDRRYR
jgi:RNA recognition motif-containing protein